MKNTTKFKFRQPWLIMLLCMFVGLGVFAQTGSGVKAPSTLPITIQLGQPVNDAFSHPYFTLYKDNHSEILYTAAEITAAGGIAGDITGYAFNVVETNSFPMNNFTVGLQNYSSSTLTSMVTSGFTTVYTGTYAVPGTGWQTVNFTTPFVWDGVSNVLISICFDNDGYDGSTAIYAESVTDMMWEEYSDTGSGCSFIDGSANTERPNIRLFIEPEYNFPTGTIQGFITNAYGVPMSGATVVAQGIYEDYTATSEPNGSYILSDVFIGSYTLSAGKAGFNISTIEGLVVAEATTTYQNFSLTQPSMAITPNPYTVNLNPNEYLDGALNIANNGSGPLSWNAEIVFPENAHNNGITINTPTGIDFNTLSRSETSLGEGSMIPDGNGEPLNSRDMMTCPEGSVFSNNPVGSDNGFTSSDEFTCYQGYTTTEDFNTITFWSLNTATPPATQNFTIEVRAAGATPGAVVSSFTADIAAVPTGVMVIGYPVFQYTVEVPKVTLTSGYIGVHSNTSTPTFYWLNSTSGIGTAFQAKSGAFTQITGFLPLCLSSSSTGAWLTLGQTEGTVNATSGFALPLYFNANGAEAGEVYTADVVFTSTPNVGTVTIPVTMTIAGNALGMPDDLTATLADPIAGSVNLSWTFAPADGFVNFVVKRNNVAVGYTTGNTFTNILPGFGTYNYTVQAVYDEGASVPAGPVEVEWPNPTLLLNPTALSNAQYPVTSEPVTFRVSNTGEGTMAFAFPEFTSDRGMGGPDAFGYVWTDSDQEGGAQYVWNDIAATGTAIPAMGDDAVVGSFPIGFSFPFYGNNYTDVSVSSNGYLIFGSQTSAYANKAIPTAATPNNIIAWCWDDLTGVNGSVYYQNMGDHWVIQFTDYHKSSTKTITAQVHLYLSGHIKMYYKTLADGFSSSSATVGIENNDGTIGTQMSFNTAYLHNNMAINIDFPIPSFITAVHPAQGTVPAGQFVDVTATFTADNLYYPVGTYASELEMTTNDQAHSTVIIPATMSVYESAQLAGTVTDITSGAPLNGVTVTANTEAARTNGLSFQTMTNDNGEYSMIVDPATYTVTFDKIGYSSFTAENIVAPEQVVTTVNAQLREGAYPPSFVYAEVNATDTEALVTWGDGSGPYEIVYDDGTAENYAAWALPGGMNAVKFTPANYPVNVTGGRIYVGDGSFPNNNTGFLGTTFGAMVIDDNGTNGLPGTVLDSISVTVNNYGWLTFTGLDADVADGSFYLAMVQATQSPNTAPLGIDQQTPTVYRSYSRNVTAGGTWGLAPYQDFMMRAIVFGSPAIDGEMMADNSAEFRIPAKQRGLISLTAPLSAAGGVEQSGIFKAALDMTDNTRAVTGYRVVRYSNFNPENEPSTGTLTELTANVTGNTYTDTPWANLPAGWYAYGVAAKYADNFVSDIAISNVVGHKIDAKITVNVSLTTATSPAGAVVTLTGSDYPNATYTATVPESGQVIFPEMWFGHYTFTVAKIGFDDYTMSQNITGDRIIDVVLAEKKYTPRNLYVDPLSLVATWDEPLAISVLEDFEGSVFPPEGWSKYTQNTNGWFASTDGGSDGFEIPAHTQYAVTNDDAADGDGCCDYLWTPVMDWTELSSYRLNFNSFFTGAYGHSAYIEISTDEGETWTVINTLAGGSAWQEVEVDLTSYSGATGLNHVMVAFHADDNGESGTGWAIDDVQIASGGVPFSGYGVFLDGTLTGNTPETTFTYTNLNYGQTYLAGVAALFSSGYSEQDTYQFRSQYLCPPVNLQGDSPAHTSYAHLWWEKPQGGGGVGGTLTEDFEAGTLPEGWVIYDVDGDGHNWENTAEEYTAFDAHSGSFCMTSASYINNVGALTPNNWLVTPSVEIGSSSELRFWVDGQDPAYAEEQFYVKVSTETNAVADFTNTVYSGVATPDWSEVVVDLSDFAGETVYVAIQHADVSDMFFIKIDDLSISNSESMWPATTPVQPGVCQSMPFKTVGMTESMIATELAAYTQNLNADRDRAVKGLIGYNVYRDGALATYVAHPTLEAFDYNLDPAVYSYHVTAVYDLTPYGYAGQTAESMMAGPIDVEVIYGFELPFVENFNNGFDVNNWTVDGDNWVIDGQAGNPAPSAKFTYDPAQTDYSLSLNSSWINGKVIDGKILLDFDLKLDDNTATGEEKMKVEIFNGSAWTTVGTYTAEGDFAWDAKQIDITNTAKDKVFRVRFTATGANTLAINNWLVDNIHIYRVCEAPANLTAKINDHFGDQVELAWEAPAGPVVINAWLAWDSGTNTGNGVGMNGGGTFSCAARFTAAQLTEYAGSNLTKIRIFPNAATGSTFVLKVWTGANASQLVVSQPVPSFVDSQWNEFVLNTPVPVTATTELWFGYTVTHANELFPAGCDEGPAVAGFGDMISMDGSAWDAMSVLVASLNYNWNIEGLVESTGKAPISLQPVADPSVYTGNGALVLSTNANANSVSVPADNTKGRELTGYKIFRDGNFLINTTETSYLDNDPAISVLGKVVCYKVTAVYTDCESDFSNEKCVTITSNGDVATDVLSIYPNPSNDMVNIELTDNISQFVVYNYLGQVVTEQVVTKNQTVRLNVSNYEAGAYMVKFITRSGESISRKIVVTK